MFPAWCKHKESMKMFPLHLTDLDQVKHFCTNALFHIVEEDNIYFPKSPKKWSDNQILSIGLSYNPSYPFMLSFKFKYYIPLDPKTQEKWRFYTPNVITPKNEGCGFPW